MIFDHIFCDIGDDQSIVENLSTFSSHMKKMVAIVNQVTPNSLALFDEIGSGTDPVEGAQIAISVLNYFVKKNVSFITTTHYAELKAYAYTKERVVNASMAFNEDTRVKIPAILTLTRLGYKYLSLKNAVWDTSTNIFTNIILQQITTDVNRGNNIVFILAFHADM